MTLPISLTPSAALPATNIHPHGGTSTSSASSIQPAPDGSTQGLFSTIFNSLEGVIGANTGIQLGSILNTKA